MVSDNSFRIPDAIGAVELFRDRQVRKPSYGAVASQDSSLGMTKVDNQQQVRKREILEFASNVQDAGGVNNSISRPQTSTVNPLSKVITEVLQEYKGYDVTVYNSEDILKNSLIGELKEQAKKQGYSFIHFQLSEGLLAQCRSGTEGLAITGELKCLVNESLGKQKELGEEKSSQHKIIIYIDPVDKFAERYLNEAGTSISGSHESDTELALLLRAIWQAPWNNDGRIRKMSFVLPLGANGSTIANAGIHNRINMVNNELRLVRQAIL
jgi:hypothetical protein